MRPFDASRERALCGVHFELRWRLRLRRAAEEHSGARHPAAATLRTTRLLRSRTKYWCGTVQDWQGVGVHYAAAIARRRRYVPGSCPRRVHDRTACRSRAARRPTSKLSGALVLARPLERLVGQDEAGVKRPHAQ